MNTAPRDTELEHRLRDFAAAWLRLGEPGVGDELVADPILVLGPQGTSAVPRGAFLAAVTERRRQPSHDHHRPLHQTEIHNAPVGGGE